MSSKDREELARISARSRAMNVAARESCRETQEHIKASRGAIARSLGLLSDSGRFTGLDRD